MTDPRESAMLETGAIHALLAHRYPFLLVDRIRVVERGKVVVGTKRVTAGEWWCVGESPLRQMPFSLVIEALAQTSGALVRDLLGDAEGTIAYFMGVQRVRLRDHPRPGDELSLELTLRQWRRGICRTRGVATVDGRLVASADLTTVVRSPT
jgi:3-hydroxyacyl-[acyl-carrier-protein] dehydratase